MKEIVDGSVFISNKKAGSKNQIQRSAKITLNKNQEPNRDLLKWKIWLE